MYATISNLPSEEVEQFVCSPLIENNIWITAYGRKIPVKRMSTSHIKNCIKCWNSKGETIIPEDYLGGKKKWLKIFNQELINRN